MNDLSCGIHMWEQVSFVLSQCVWQMDRQTDGQQKGLRNTVHCIICSCTERQDAQLSQRDRAAGCVLLLPQVEHWNWETIFYGHCRSIFNNCDIISLKICQIR